MAAAEQALGSGRLAPAEVGRFHGFVALGFVLLERFCEADAAARMALAAAEASGDPFAALYGYYSLTVRYLVLGELEQSLRFSERALTVLEVSASPGRPRRGRPLELRHRHPAVPVPPNRAVPRLRHPGQTRAHVLG